MGNVTRCAVALFASMLLLATGCAERASSNAPPTDAASPGPVKRHIIPFGEIHPTVGLKEYTLVTDDLERDRPEADEVVRVKIGLPHAMQTKRREDFEAVLGRDFVFTAIDEHFDDREAYISNRVVDPSKVKQADYRNVTVQFIGATRDRALVTYSNIVEDEPGGPGAWKADMTWADILAKEGGRWKYEIVHTIEFRDLTTPK